ncbi:DNA replication licensing factor MCM5 [Pancytospora philotis]|nr:DNA replication licensing factor MCM5 [Pancytospora philotis]
MEYQSNAVNSLDLFGQERAVNAERLGAMFVTFLTEYRTADTNYFQVLNANLTQRVYHVAVFIDHLAQFSTELMGAFEKAPLDALEVFEGAVCRKYGLPRFQIQMISTGRCASIRSVSAEKSNRVVRVRGIVISASTIITKPKELFLTCKSCLSTRTTRDVIPRTCEKSECPLDPFVVVPEKSVVVDVQYGKLQEDFEDIPVGETPRHISVVFEADMADRIIPGSAVRLTGVFMVSGSGGQGLFRVLGIEGIDGKLRKSFTEDEELLFKELARSQPYRKIARSIAPSIFGSDDIKMALACMLFGGTRRSRGDGISLRGDINILLLGDPGIAKSQLLKFVAGLAPVGVYTSGKGSSAAGLTASVLRDKHSGWVLEGGALVLADNGVCCIDEFDKMRESDRVAIHEAMEQQTISIAKAGITTILNTRTAVLAAANPVFGRYDDYKTPTENIEFGTTILSRFDLIFILKDAHGPRDRQIAEHVLNLHTEASGSKNPAGAEDELVAPETLRNYVQYAKRISPALSSEASAKLSRFYVSVRQDVAGMQSGAKKCPVPITVRQLESLIRISEALARMELSSIVTVAHVGEAIRLFQLSTMSAVAQGHMIEGMVRPSFFDEINAIITKIKDCMPVGASRRFSDVVGAVDAKESLVKSAVDYMFKQNKMLLKESGKILVRLP